MAQPNPAKVSDSMTREQQDMVAKGHIRLTANKNGIIVAYCPDAGKTAAGRTARIAIEKLDL